ncbi:hypothetical protein FB451DRAFT_1282374, partial [Mycena latifolia]
MAYPKPGATTPRILRPYDVTYHPRCLDITFQELRFLGSDIGQAVRALNSTFGIPSDVHQALIEDSVLCPVCSCQYSEDGFNDHIQLGACGNCPKPFPVASRPPPSRTIDLALRVLPDGKCFGNITEFLDTPIGAALLQWNSRLGIPTDVWALASTAVIHCPECNLVRSFQGHLAHLHPTTHECNDII